ncbi:MAG: 2-oxo-4-hydroxy-4-carboxy-5-ureidoimidazoline decarboxylase [Polyangiaceae bacterium]
MTEPSGPSTSAVAHLDSLPEAEARQLLARCCGASRWVESMLGARPFRSPQALLAQADAVWVGLEGTDYLEAFSHHPEIGADLAELRKKFASTAELSLGEQAGAANASEAVLLALRSGNQAYRERFGYSFIVCATGKSAAEMLSLLEQRLANPAESELHNAAAEQAKITRLRLEKLGTP